MNGAFETARAEYAYAENAYANESNDESIVGQREREREREREDGASVEVLTFGEPPEFFGGEDARRQDGVVVDDSVVRIVSISCERERQTDRQTERRWWWWWGGGERQGK